MPLLRHTLHRLARDRRGVSVLEYTLITVIIGTVILSGVNVIGTALTTAFSAIGTTLSQNASGL